MSTAFVLAVFSIRVPSVNTNKMIFEAGAAQLKQNYTCLMKCDIFNIRINCARENCTCLRLLQICSRSTASLTKSLQLKRMLHIF